MNVGCWWILRVAYVLPMVERARHGRCKNSSVDSSTPEKPNVDD